MILHLPRKQVNTFKKKALSTNKEIQVILIGREEGDKIIITTLHYPKLLSSTTHECGFDLMDYIKLKLDTLEPYKVFGTIHSHPHCTPYIRKGDIIAVNELSEKVFGIFSYWKPRGSTRRGSSLDFYSEGKLIKYILKD